MNKENCQQSFQTPLGTDQNLPIEIRDMAGLRSRVVAWTTVDPAYDIDKYINARVFGMFVLPCFWPHLLLCWPLLWAGKAASVNAAKSQYWILDEKELKIVLVNHEQCCIPGCSTSGNIVRSIPLPNITDCGFDESGKGKFNTMSGDLPTIYVDTASSSNSQGRRNSHEATGLALKGSKAFVDAILQQRDKVSVGSGTTSSIRNSSAQTGSTADRLRHLKELFDNEILTAEEYERQRQEIIASI